MHQTGHLPSGASHEQKSIPFLNNVEVFSLVATLIPLFGLVFLNWDPRILAIFLSAEVTTAMGWLIMVRTIAAAKTGILKALGGLVAWWFGFMMMGAGYLIASAFLAGNLFRWGARRLLDLLPIG